MLPSLSAMSAFQKDELDSIKAALENKLNSLGLRTKHESIRKTESGYTFSRRCKQKDCRAYVNQKINVRNRSGIISFNENCKQHH